MSEISASLVKELREQTGAAMMDCKKALVESNGDIQAAIEILRIKGNAKADKKAGRTAAEGLVAIDGKAMIEVNSETDFVARDSNFVSFVKSVATTAMNEGVNDVTEFSKLTLAGTSQTVEEARLALVAKVGENVQIRRIVVANPNAACVGTYLHGNRIGVMVELDVDNVELARDIAMHIAASKPTVIDQKDVSDQLIAKEKEIYSAQAASSGKPADIIEKMVAGRLKKFLDEVSLLGQAFVKDPDVNVGGLLAKNRAKVLNFYRFEVGEGIEKTVEDFKEAVLSQAQNS